MYKRQVRPHRLPGARIVGSHKLQTGLRQGAADRVQIVGALVMGLLEFLVERLAKAGYIPPDEQGQIILVDLLIPVVKILPDRCV